MIFKVVSEFEVRVFVFNIYQSLLLRNSKYKSSYVSKLFETQKIENCFECIIYYVLILKYAIILKEICLM